MIGESALTSIKWFGVDGPATSVKYESHSVKERAQAQYARRRLRACEPSRVPVVGILLGRVGAVGHGHAVGAWEGPEVVVEPMVLLDQDDHVLDRRLGGHETHIKCDVN
jgi:hypothetical protein